MLRSKILRELLSNLKMICNIFPDLNSRVFDNIVEELSNHTYTFIKSIIIKYIEVRMFSHSKICSLGQIGLNLRHYMKSSINMEASVNVHVFFIFFLVYYTMYYIYIYIFIHMLFCI